MTVEELIAREQIRQCILRHFRAVDRVDPALERRAFWEDGRFLGGPVEGSATAFVDPLFTMLPASFDTTMHYIANMLITVEGSRGLVELYGIGWHLLVDDAATIEAVIGAAMWDSMARDATRRYEMSIGVRYAVEMQRRGEEWRILTMQPIIEWTRVQPYAGIVEGGLPAAMPTPAMRAGGDASYFGGAFRP